MPLERKRAIGFDMNPSPGNIRDGLITDAMKSAGAAKKGGTSPVTAVLDYPEYSCEPGLNLQCTPGNRRGVRHGPGRRGSEHRSVTTGWERRQEIPIAPVVKTLHELAAYAKDAGHHRH